MASTLRRRVLGGGGDGDADADANNSTPTTPSESPTPSVRDDDDSPARPGEKVKVVHHRHQPLSKTRKRRNTFIFLLGSLFGILLAGFLANNNELISLPEIGDLSMDSILDVLPAGLAKDMREFVVCSRSRRKEGEPPHTIVFFSFLDLFTIHLLSIYILRVLWIVERPARSS